MSITLLLALSEITFYTGQALLNHSSSFAIHFELMICIFILFVRPQILYSPTKWYCLISFKLYEVVEYRIYRLVLTEVHYTEFRVHTLVNLAIQLLFPNAAGEIGLIKSILT